jgi:hypothetical protein
VHCTSSHNYRRCRGALAPSLLVVFLLAGVLATWAAESASSTAAALPPDASDLRYEIYQVCSGDTVQNIAARFGVPPEQILQLNGLSEVSALAPGQSLVIVLAGRKSNPSAQPPAGPTVCSLPPRYGVVVAAQPITGEPGDGDVLYQPPTGTRLIVNGEALDVGSDLSCWGVVMIDGSTGWIAKSALEITGQTVSADTLETMLRGGRPDIVQEAFRYLGTPYRYGGRLPASVDCSLFVQVVFAARGVSLPRTAAAQFEVGRAVNYADLLPGDRLYFVSRSGHINHTAIHIGGGRFIHASSRHGCVAVDSLSSPIYWMRFVGARRS